MAIYKRHGKNIEIDDEMLPIIVTLHKLGLNTLSCCSGHPEKGKHMAQLAFKVKDVHVLMHDDVLSINWRRK
jgi:hypothetical protein